MDNNYSLSDVAALLKNNGGFGEGNGLAWLILIFLVLGGSWGFGNRGAAPGPAVPPNVATVTDVQGIVNNQAINTGLNNIALSSANNNYETAQLISGAVNNLTTQNYTNQINAIQGFNSVNQTLQGGFDNLNQNFMVQMGNLQLSLNQLGHQMETCCCSIKEQMMQNRLDEANRRLSEAQNKIDSMQSANYILSNQGRYVPWAGSGSATSSSIAS